ncbi:hypothetical protein BvCmsOUP061_02796 [Escherichia coli]|nr:hypothetical protein [Escherichia coli]GDR97521.1 hypothetical protein BvCmsOUP061_02796 [Escherichia coli]
MKFSKFSELVNRILSNNHSHRRDMDVTIVVHSPGRIGSTPSVEVQSIQAGFDWDAGQVMIFPAQPLTTLTPEQVADITDSVRKGQSWHAYQEYKKHKEQLEKLSMELEAAKQREKDLFMENVRLKSGIAGLIHLGIRYADVEVMKIAGDAQLSTPCTDSIINSIAAGIFTKEGVSTMRTLEVRAEDVIPGDVLITSKGQQCAVKSFWMEDDKVTLFGTDGSETDYDYDELLVVERAA